VKTIHVNLNKTGGPVKPVNGICNGPVSYEGAHDMRSYYKQARFPYCRLHDVNWPRPREVDVPAIFKNFDADAKDPANYSFKPTDIYIAQIIETGAEIIWRLGVNIGTDTDEESAALKRNANPQKWADICVHIIMHYNDGWADGFHYNIKYWEIWNEPESGDDNNGVSSMFVGFWEDYLRLYETASKAIKTYNPKLLVGGYAATLIVRPKDYMLTFLERVKETASPLDFFSFHRYIDDPQITVDWANLVDRKLTAAGFKDVPVIIDEWNFMLSRPGIWEDLNPKNNPNANKVARELFDLSHGYVGAACKAGTLIAMNDCRVDIATCYDGQPSSTWCAVFDRYGNPEKSFYSFIAYDELRKDEKGETPPKRAEIAPLVGGLYALAVAKSEGAALMVVPYTSGSGVYHIEIEGLDAGATYLLEKRLTDENHTFDLVQSRQGKLTELPLDTALNEKSVLLLTLRQVQI
jgi:hypothetical protein